MGIPVLRNIPPRQHTAVSVDTLGAFQCLVLVHVASETQAGSKFESVVYFACAEYLQSLIDDILQIR